MEELVEKAKDCQNTRTQYMVEYESAPPCPENTPNNVTHGKYVCGSLIKCDHYIFAYIDYFDEYDKKIHKKIYAPTMKDEFYWTDYPNNSKLERDLYTDDDEVDIQRLYDMCHDLIDQHNIDIISEEINLENYHRGGSYSGQQNTFIFNCQKGNFQFDLSFDHDCDCYPGILKSKTVIEISSGDKINAECDFFCQNKSKNKMANFISLINSEDYNDFKESRYGHLLRLPQLLGEYGFTVKPLKPLEIDGITINDYDFNFILEVKCDIGTCYVIPHDGCAQYMDNYILYICPTFDDIYENYDHTCDTINININTFNHNMKSDGYAVLYKVNDDIYELVDTIKMYINYKNNDYGFLESDGFKNDTNIEEWIDSNIEGGDFKKYELLKYGISNTLIGLDFDIFIEFIPDYNICVYVANRLQKAYMYDFYGIHFWYDRNIDSDNCVLTIQGKCYDLMNVINGELAITDRDIQTSSNKRSELHDSCIVDMGTYHFAGSFTECFNEMTGFVSKIKEIIGS